MDPKVLEALRQIVVEATHNAITGAWWFWMVVIVLPAISAWIGGYFKKRAETAAIQADIQTLQSQLSRNTEITAQINARVGFEEWWARELFSTKRSSLERITTLASQEPEDVHEWWKQATSSGGDFNNFPMAALHELSTTAALYHPALKDLVRDFSDASLAFQLGASDFWDRHHKNSPIDLKVLKAILADRNAKYKDLWPALIDARERLRDAAHSEMQTLLQHPPAITQ